MAPGTEHDPAAPAPTAADGDLSGRVLGEYRVLRRLGAGGMGQVYLAEQTSLRRRVALKILKRELAENPASLQRFQAEAEAVARATHANIVQVYAIGEADGRHYMALEYVEGRNLRDYLARRGPPDVPAALSIMRQVAAALQRASELGIIHRDIKPENILITRQGEVKVADFGLSRVLGPDQPALNLTQSGVSMGTPLYMSPEQVEGKPLDARTDIYSFGVTCYHMLAGQPPFRGQNPFEVALQHVRSEPEPLGALRPDLPPELSAVVHRMMAKSPEERYPSCRELLHELARLRDEWHDLPPGAVTQALEMDFPLADTDVSGMDVAVGSGATSSGPGNGSRGSGAGTRTTGGPRAGREGTASTGQQVTRPRRGDRGVALVLAVLVLPALVGAGAGWIALRAGWVGGGDGAAEAAEPGPLPSEVEREKFLLTALDQYANVEGDPERLRLGMGHSVELAVFYLERNRLADAERLFARLDSPGQAVRPYRTLGRLGRAIVLALQDRAAESNELFLQFLKEAKGDRARLSQMLFLNQNPRLRQWVARALDHNLQNATPEEPFPEALDALRRPPAAGPSKKAEKGSGRTS